MEIKDVGVIKHPQQLRISQAHESRKALPALKALALLEERLVDLDFTWGPTGSVGLELATGDCVISKASDLDLAFFAAERLTHAAARSLWDILHRLPVKVDALVETFSCGFSLEEFALQRSSKVMIRTPTGRQLVENPWDAGEGHSR